MVGPGLDDLTKTFIKPIKKHQTHVYRMFIINKGTSNGTFSHVSAKDEQLILSPVLIRAANQRHKGAQTHECFCNLPPSSPLPPTLSN